MFIPLKYKVAASIIIIMIVTLSFLSHYITRNVIMKDKREEFNKRAEVMALLIANLKITQIVDRKLSNRNIQSFINSSIKLNPDIAFILLYDRKGKVELGAINREIISKDAAEDINQLSNIVVGPRGRQRLKDIMIFTVDLQERSGLTGSVKVAFSTLPLNRRIMQVRVRIVIISVFACIVSLMAAFILSRRITRPIEVIADAMDFVAQGDLDQTVSFNRNDEIGDISRAFNAMTRGLQERERIKDTFSRYVTKQVAERILNDIDSINLEGEWRKVTVMFSDIRDFTSLSEKLHPKQVVEVLNMYFDKMIDVIFKYEGILDKFIGDSILALWGAPIEQKDQEWRAVRTGIEMFQQLRILNRELKFNGYPPLRMGIGINTGGVIAGNIGSIKKMEYTVIGDNVNVAQRIESYTKNIPDGCLLISHSTYMPIASRIKVERLTPIVVKGRKAPIQVYNVPLNKNA
jgi:class 3 adenylate cyclase